MHFSNLHYLPFELFFFFLLLGTLILLIVLIEFDILEYAYERIGISRRYIFSLLLLNVTWELCQYPCCSAASAGNSVGYKSHRLWHPLYHYLRSLIGPVQ